MRPPQNPSKCLAPVENSLVKEYEGRLAGSKRYAVKESTSNINLQVYGGFPPIQIPKVRAEPIVSY